MTEFMLLVRNLADHTNEPHGEFLAACQAYITELQRAGQLIAAQPLVRTGSVVTRDSLRAIERGEIQVGYYHVRAASLDDAIAIARRNPELAFSTTAAIEVRPIKTAETTTGFEYPR